MIRNGITIQKIIPPKTTAITRFFQLYACSAHFLNLFIDTSPFRNYTIVLIGAEKNEREGRLSAP
jgi:hypothetical protein